MNLKEFVCPYCGKQISSKAKLRKHISRCISNPNISKRFLKYATGHMDSEEKDAYIHEKVKFVCTCKTCGKTYTVETTRHHFDIEDYSHYCSIQCRNTHHRTDESKQKVSESIRRIYDECPEFLTDEIIESNPHKYVYKNGIKFLYIFNRHLKVYKCENCGKEFTILHKRDTSSDIYCSLNCLVSSDNLDKKLSYISHEKRCHICGDINCTNDFCKDGQMFQKIKTLIKYFHFDENTLGSHDVFAEWERLRQELYDLYVTQHLSTIELSKIYHYKASNMSNILGYFAIKRRTFSEALKVAVLYNRLTISSSYFYHSGEHLTWNNKLVYLRSSYEFDYAKIGFSANRL